MKRVYFTFLSVIILVVFTATLTGCIAETPATQVQNPNSTQVAPGSTLAANSPTPIRPSEEIASVPTSAQGDVEKKSSPDPFVSKSVIKRGMYLIPNCTMGQLIPAVKDPNYGLNSYKQIKLIFMSDGDFNKVIREYTENTGAFSMCYGLPEEPYWDFASIDSMLTARNAKPVTYNITLLVNFRGVEGPKYTTQMTLNPGQMYPLKLYVPIRVDQFRELGNYEFQFEEIN